MGMFGVLVRNPYSELEDGADVADLYVDDILEMAEKLQPIIAARNELARTRCANRPERISNQRTVSL